MTAYAPTTDELAAALKRNRLSSYARLRGGYSIPLAGAVYWAVLGVLGSRLDLREWALAAQLGTGAIFPLALLLSSVLRNPFMKDKSAVTSVLVPTFIGMLLFWPMLVAAAQVAPELISIILAIGMSIHWPVIGWSYGRTFLFSAHAIVRAIVCLFIWLQYPDERLTWLPVSVAIIYLATVAIILVDSALLRRRS